MKVVVAVEGEVTTRAAQSLSAHPGIDVTLLGPTNSSQFRTVQSVDGFDVVVGAEKAVAAAAAATLPVVSVGKLAAQPGIFWASITGLALALAGEVPKSTTVAVAVPGDAAGDQTVVFPSPIDARSAVTESVDGRRVQISRGDSSLAAVLALGPDRHRVIVDDYRFMEGVALAAAIGILMENGVIESSAVWHHPIPYLRTAAEMGLVIGERSAVV